MLFELRHEVLGYKGTKVLHDLSLEIKRGEKVALLGRSGSGKSTLLRHLFSLCEGDCAYIPQELGLVQTLSLFHNVYMAKLDRHSSFYNLCNLFFPKKEEQKAVKSLLQKLSMEELLFRPCMELSGGQMQRTAVARALYTDSTTLLADEPISALDENLSRQTLHLLHESFETIVCTLHNVPLALEYFDRIIGLREGQIILDKACEDIDKEDTEQLYYVCEC